MASSVVLACVGAVILCALKVFHWLWWKPKRLERYFRGQGIEGPSYKLIHGNLREHVIATKEARAKPMKSLFSHSIAPRVLPFLHRNLEKYGKVSLFWVGRTPRVDITDPDLVRDVLSNKSGELIKTTPNPLTKLFLNGIVSHNGDKWAKHRRIMNPAFHLEKLKMMLPAFHASCDELITRWEKLFREGPCELDVVPEIQLLTSDVISRAAFGSNYKQGRRIFELQAQQLEFVAQALQTAYIPGYRFLPTKMNKRMKDMYKEVGVILRAMVEEREKAIIHCEVLNKDLLTLLIDSNLKETQDYQGSCLENKGMKTDEIIEECKVFYFAGQETTAIFLVWTIVLLAMHQEWQDRAREEVLQTFGTNKPDFDGLSHLKIVPMILYEVLRLYPPIVNTLLRCTDKATKLGEINLPPRVLIGMPILLIHHDRDIWGEDVEEFNPKRFSEGISKASKHKTSFYPFGWGPRICIGQQFALTEAKIALTMILQRFSFELSSTYVHAPHQTFTLQPQHGAQIVFHKL
ncbi:hypothetical protein Sjap_025644 [Stephania japonica]|uniref:Cytochrome P450 n=1 Tax=Stephania japonica TaxID=461633 RepID=A0AAP0E582_9MAGN